MMIHIDRTLLIDTLLESIKGDANVTRAKLAHTIEKVLREQKVPHDGECKHEKSARDVCEGMYVDKCDDVIQLSEMLRGVRTKYGEDRELGAQIAKVLSEHGDE